MIQVPVTKEAEKIIVYEVSPRRRLFAKDFCAPFGLNFTTDDVVAKVRELCDGMGADVAFDVALVQAGLDQAIEATRFQGTLVNIAIWGKPTTVSPNRLAFREAV